MARTVHLPEGDLRDLRILRVLLEERHVSRAAERLGMTQSAVSKALGRLRHRFSDALLIRGSGGYQLSHNAKTIEPKLHAALDQIDGLTAPRSDVPSKLDAEIRLSMADDAAILLLPRIQERLDATAPGVKLSVMNTGQDVLDQLRSGAMDLLIEDSPDRGSGFYSHPLFDWTWCCLMAANHPLATRPLTFERYVGANHGLVSFSGDRFGAVDEVLGTLDRQRRIVLVVPYFSAVPFVVQSTDLIFTVPQPLGARLAVHFDLALRPLPIDVPPLNMALIWHHRNQHDSIHRWVRRFLMDELAAPNVEGVP